ncbi:MAG: efflux transporter periplasmic adaptor subunit, partial [Pseudanabaenaceae cyanobacterium]
SPVADAVARLIPVEIVVPNRGNKLGSGQLARVQFSGRQAQQIVIAETALEAAGRPPQSGKPPESSNLKSPNLRSTSSGSPNQSANQGSNQSSKGKTGTVFVVTGDAKEPTVSARQVTLGDRRDGKVVILSGLQQGDRVVVRSGGRLKDGDAVKMSVLSEK